VLDHAGLLIRSRLPAARRTAIVTDETVGGLYGQRLASALQPATEVATVTIAEGEASKSIRTVEAIYDALAAFGLERSDRVVALGGGVVLDIAGFAASTYLRGVRLVLVPTTLLAMVDASIGGKTAVNRPEGKNRVGTFAWPELVLADPDVLGTLELSHVREGLAEVLKAAIIGDPDLLAQLERDGTRYATAEADWAPLVIRAARVKAQAVSADPLENGPREALNLGHTFGHALETASGFTLAHGAAVAVGVLAAARLAARLDLAEAHLPARVERALEQLRLPATYAGPSPPDVLAAMSSDKKRRGGRNRYVLPRGPGDVVTGVEAPDADVLAVLDSVWRPAAPRATASETR
jgi:3-dehydroquinate synthase